MSLDHKLAANKVRTRLEKRLAVFLGCEVGDLPRLQLGVLLHVAFALWGDSEELGGFNPTMVGFRQLLSYEILWDIEPKAEETEETPKVVVN